MQQARIRDVVGVFIVGLFGLALLIFTAVANLSLLVSVYPDPQFVAFGLLALEGGTICWTSVYFLTSVASHKGLCVIGVAMDTLISFTGFMYEMSNVTHTVLPVQLPVIYVIGGAVVFNVTLALCYKLIPTGQEFHLPNPMGMFRREVPAQMYVQEEEQEPPALPEPEPPPEVVGTSNEEMYVHRKNCKCTTCRKK